MHSNLCGIVWHHGSLSKGKKLYIANWRQRSALTLIIAIYVFLFLMKCFLLFIFCSPI